MKSENELKNYLRYTDTVMIVGLILVVAAGIFFNEALYAIPYLGGWLTARILLMIGIAQIGKEDKKMNTKNLYVNIIVYLIVFGIFFYVSLAMFLTCFIALFAYRKIYFLFIAKLYL